jgi:HTH-type transcriptional regulator/antitoxin HigA
LLTVKDSKEFVPEMLSLCAESGVALSLVPEMKKAPWHGATKWLSASKAMILLNLRGKTEDQFWFSFFHEAGHVLHDSKKDLYINDGSSDDPREHKANEFAAQILIPSDRNMKIASLRAKADVIRLAAELKISPGIVVGRFQRLTEKWNYFNGLKRRFEWVSANK